MERKLTPNLMVKEVGATMRYYRDVLAFAPVMYVTPDRQIHHGFPESTEPEWGMVKKGDVEIFFQQEKSLAKEYPDLKGRAPGGSLTLYIYVDEVEELYKAIAPRADVVKKLETTFYGAVEFAVRDPNGFILCFGRVPGAAE